MVSLYDQRLIDTLNVLIKVAYLISLFVIVFYSEENFDSFNITSYMSEEQVIEEEANEQDSKDIIMLAFANRDKQPFSTKKLCLLCLDMIVSHFSLMLLNEFFRVKSNFVFRLIFIFHSTAVFLRVPLLFR